MESDDKIRTRKGIAICLRDMGNNTSRIFFDDVTSSSEANPIKWSYDCFYTFTPELENAELNEMSLSKEQYQKIGEAIVARLLTLNGRNK